MAADTAPRKDNVLTRKIGPLPMWAWTAIVLVVVVGYSLYKNKQNAAAASTTDQTNASQVPEFVNQTYVSPAPPSAPGQPPVTGPGGSGPPEPPPGTHGLPHQPPPGKGKKPGKKPEPKKKPLPVHGGVGVEPGPVQGGNPPVYHAPHPKRPGRRPVVR